MSFPTSFLPPSNTITSITQANPCVVTTGTDHGYLSGLYVRLNLLGSTGMRELDNNVYLIVVLSNNSFTIGINTLNFESWALDGSSQVPQVIPVGEVSDSLLQAERNSGQIRPEASWINVPINM